MGPRQDIERHGYRKKHSTSIHFPSFSEFYDLYQGFDSYLILHYEPGNLLTIFLCFARPIVYTTVMPCVIATGHEAIGSISRSSLRFPSDSRLWTAPLQRSERRVYLGSTTRATE